jgi:hypothetical protein
LAGPLKRASQHIPPSSRTSCTVTGAANGNASPSCGAPRLERDARTPVAARLEHHAGDAVGHERRIAVAEARLRRLPARLARARAARGKLGRVPEAGRVVQAEAVARRAERIAEVGFRRRGAAPAPDERVARVVLLVLRGERAPPAAAARQPATGTSAQPAATSVVVVVDVGASSASVVVVVLVVVAIAAVKPKMKSSSGTPSFRSAPGHPVPFTSRTLAMTATGTPVSESTATMPRKTRWPFAAGISASPSGSPSSLKTESELTPAGRDRRRRHRTPRTSAGASPATNVTSVALPPPVVSSIGARRVHVRRRVGRRNPQGIRSRGSRTDPRRP